MSTVYIVRSAPTAGTMIMSVHATRQGAEARQADLATLAADGKARVKNRLISRAEPDRNTLDWRRWHKEALKAFQVEEHEVWVDIDE